MIIGLLLNYVGIAPFRMLYLTAVLNGVLAPPLIVLIVLMAGNKKIMGKAASGKISKTIGWIAATLMGIAVIALLYTFVR
jgi:Mn2+/Fe2+ NRAMP family transporter